MKPPATSSSTSADTIAPHPSDTPLLALRALAKRYDEAFTLGPIDLALYGGQAVALHGRNGAGKSTLLKLVTGSLDATGGEVLLAGRKLTPDKPELKRQIGYLPQDSLLPRWVTGREILNYGAALHRLENAPKVIARAEETWDCARYRDKPLATLSHGMQKRIGLALATISDPPVLILDEPFEGLDVEHVRALNAEIARRCSAGHLTMLSTHIAPYTARLCHRALILDAGRLEELKDWGSHDYLARITAIEARFDAVLGKPAQS